jgi:vancomycin resistance protein YoaR
MLVAAMPVLLLVAGAAGWLIDLGVHSGEVVRNVTLSGTSIGGLGEESLTEFVEELAAEQQGTTVEIRTPDRTITATAADLGLGIDVEETVDEALDVGRDRGVGGNFLAWSGGFLDDQVAPVLFEVDREVLRTTLGRTQQATRSDPVEPTFEFVDGQIVVTPGIPGAHVDVNQVAERMPSAVDLLAETLVIEVDWAPVPPFFDDDDVDAALAEAAELTDEPIWVEVNGAVAALAPETIRRWIVSDTSGMSLQPVFDEAKAKSAVEAHLSGLSTEATDPTFTVVDDRVVVEFGDPALVCCEGEVTTVLLDAARSTPAKPVSFEARLAEPDGGRLAAEALGITELVGEFTTNHACCQSRVGNIHRMADLLRGHIIEPGEIFSINEVVGKRTRENGFVAAGAIERGRFVQDVGGGVSQFATTIFNAAFFAGLDFEDYQSHSIYISRYPYGREATLGHPAPDLALRNNTPYGVLIWPTYTDSSITVQLWSTPYYEVEELGQSRFGQGACTRVETYRKRTKPNGVEIEDEVFAVYRPGEGLDCRGRPTPGG